MAIRKQSLRHRRWQAATALAGAVPWLDARMPLYSKTAPAADYAEPRIWDWHSKLALTPEEQAFADRLPADKPLQSIGDEASQRFSLYQFDGLSLLGNTGIVIDEAARQIVTLPSMRPFANYHYMRPEPTQPVKLTGGPYFSMLHSHLGHRHYFHFLFDRLPKFHALLTKFGFGDEPVRVLIHDDLPAYQDDIFRFIQRAHPRLEWVPVGPRDRVRADTLLIIDDLRTLKSTHADPDFLAWVRALCFEGFNITAPGSLGDRPFGDQLADDRPLGDRLYVSRGDTRKRQMIGGEALEAGLAARGFEAVMPGRLSFREQIDTFMKASHVVGAHGAGLTNMLFAPAGARLFEIFPADKIKNTYFLLARSLSQSYGYAIGGESGKHEAFSIDPDEVLSALDRKIEKP
ncbi:MAG: glycosyltransferase family 61 protein [Pseudomonadota bacterium]